MSEEILAGRNSVTEALRSGRSINKLLVQDGIKGGSVSEIIGLAKTAGVVLEFCKAERLDKLADGLRHQGFVAGFGFAVVTAFVVVVVVSAIFVSCGFVVADVVAVVAAV